jgi:hypothetical protein
MSPERKFVLKSIARHRLHVRRMIEPVEFFSETQSGLFDYARTCFEVGSPFNPVGLINLDGRHYRHVHILGFVLVWSWPK